MGLSLACRDLGYHANLIGILSRHLWRRDCLEGAGRPADPARASDRPRPGRRRGALPEEPCSWNISSRRVTPAGRSRCTPAKIAGPESDLAGDPGAGRGVASVMLCSAVEDPALLDYMARAAYWHRDQPDQQRTDQHRARLRQPPAAAVPASLACWQPSTPTTPASAASRWHTNTRWLRRLLV